MLPLTTVAFLVCLYACEISASASARTTPGVVSPDAATHVRGKRLQHFHSERSTREKLQLSCLLELKRRAGLISTDIVGDSAAALAAAPANGWPDLDHAIVGDQYEFLVNGTHLQTCFYGLSHTCLLHETSYSESMCCWLAHYIFEHLIVEKDLVSNTGADGCTSGVRAELSTESTTLSSSAVRRANESTTHDNIKNGGSPNISGGIQSHQMSSSFDDLLSALGRPINQYVVFGANQSRCAEKWLKNIRKQQQLLS